MGLCITFVILLNCALLYIKKRKKKLSSLQIKCKDYGSSDSSSVIFFLHFSLSFSIAALDSRPGSVNIFCMKEWQSRVNVPWVMCLKQSHTSGSDRALSISG